MKIKEILGNLIDVRRHQEKDNQEGGWN